MLHTISVLAIALMSWAAGAAYAADAAPESGALPPVVRLSAAQEARTSTLLNADRRTVLNEIAAVWWRDPDSTKADDRWHALIADFDAPPSSADQRLLLRWALRNAYLEADREVQFHGDRVEAYTDAQARFRDESARARDWIEAHRAAGSAAVDPPFLPDAKLDRPKPIMGPNPPVVRRALATLQEVNRYAMGIERQHQQMGEDAQLALMAAQRAGARQRRLIEMVPAIIARLAP